MRGETAGDQDEGYYDQADDGADHETEDKRELVLALSKVVKALTKASGPRRPRICIHRVFETGSGRKDIIAHAAGEAAMMGLVVSVVPRGCDWRVRADRVTG
jgi:hypothetical protein